MTKAEVARRLGKPETWVGRRASGSTSFTLDDLDAIEEVIGISANYLFTGVNDENRHPDNPNGGSRSVVHPPGLEPGTHCFLVSEVEAADPSDNVVPLTPGPVSPYDLGTVANVLPFPAPALLEEVDAR